ncbi:RNA pseudouridine synthase [candidate division WOR-1 bacterium RIFCSPHIGHO2_01_FULL_53_15]|uniref:Pseudouridine synthase n=1 Tax=candidate division WOR-1 bacterium RIFCSPHIGHO2_01_FULL_53_15 TaxID=1802564 RepID=A0A1F4Q0Y4_UNCSA|nr:MAG: RNA pseudouridine synthase [candidate division WOR-1 bacterium RIFCSPHIGHO2_01_FULL_53_15]OGC10881.1 MAG: RNA pseudouridine synthase [candidate division WOR-1 bacterium RIFCSPHIGHO2_02_FULL_53_26]
MNNEFEFLISAEQKGRRLDQFLSVVADLNLSRSQIKKLIEDGLISVNDQPTEPSYKIKSDDHIKVIIPPPKELTVRPESIPLDILFEDDDIIVVNKPSGMVTHPAPGNFSGTLVNALLHHCHLSNLGAPLRPGIVHRLDKDTSGVIVAAKTDAAYASLVKQIKARTVEKTYVALVHGVIKNNAGIIEARIGRHPVHRKKMAVIESPNSKLRTPNSREAFTSYKVLKRYKNYTLVEVKIKTGRTHQIRVHLNHLGHPVVGDPTYGGRKNEFGLVGQLLHAKKLGFIHPRTGKFVEFEAGLPKELREVTQKIA